MPPKRKTISADQEVSQTSKKQRNNSDDSDTDGDKETSLLPNIVPLSTTIDPDSVQLVHLYDSFNPMKRVSRASLRAAESSMETPQKGKKKKISKRETKKQHEKRLARLDSDVNDEEELPQCCKDHTCHNTLGYHKVYSEDVQNRFMFEATLSSDFTPKYNKMNAQNGTISNNSVKLCVSDVANFPMLGLFSKVQINENDVISAYGGVPRGEHDIKVEPKAHHTHARKIPGNGYCYDGKPLADLIKHRSNFSYEVKIPHYVPAQQQRFWNSMKSHANSANASPSAPVDADTETTPLPTLVEETTSQPSDSKPPNPSASASINICSPVDSDTLTDTTTTSQPIDSTPSSPQPVSPTESTLLLSSLPTPDLNREPDPDELYPGYYTDTSYDDWYEKVRVRQVVSKGNKEDLEWTDDFDRFGNIYHCGCSSSSADKCCHNQCSCVWKQLLLQWSLAKLSPKRQKEIGQLPVCFWHEYHLPIENRTQVLPALSSEQLTLKYPIKLSDELEAFLIQLAVQRGIFGPPQIKSQHDDISNDDQQGENNSNCVEKQDLPTNEPVGFALTPATESVESITTQSSSDFTDQAVPSSPTPTDPHDQSPTPQLTSSSTSQHSSVNSSALPFSPNSNLKLPASFHQFFSKLHSSGLMAFRVEPVFLPIQPSPPAKSRDSSTTQPARPNQTQKVAYKGIVLDPSDFQHRIFTQGIGYMSNTAEKIRHNVRIESCQTVRNGTLQPELFLKASRTIPPNEEILSPYNNVDDLHVRHLKTQRKKAINVSSDESD